MKWGRRRSVATASNVPARARTISEDHNKKIVLKSKRISEMSNAELRAFNERVQLERTYKQLTKDEMSAGKKFINELIVDTGKDLAKNFVKKYANKGLEELLKKSTK